MLLRASLVASLTAKHCWNFLSRLQGLEMGKRQRIENRPQAMLEARDLPHCNLSRMLEDRLNTALQQEQFERAKEQVWACVRIHLFA
jgi:hypothetical protein